MRVTLLPSFRYILERIDLARDIHFYTNTSIDTLDYSGTSINQGSKVVVAAYGEKLRDLATEIPPAIMESNLIKKAGLALPGIISIETTGFTDYESAETELNSISDELKPHLSGLSKIQLLVLCDDAVFVAAALNNFLWVTFTRCNPSHDIYGVNSFTEHKHWGCHGPMIIDARKKPHHAPELKIDEQTLKNIAPLFENGGSLYGY